MDQIIKKHSGNVNTNKSKKIKIKKRNFNMNNTINNSNKTDTMFPSLPVKEYYSKTNFFKILNEGMFKISIERPPNPVKFLGDYLIKNKDKI